ncbi:MAG: amino acid transporter protein [Methylobacterium sp.]|nr:MAG: amino acid transporter protein [Methylobacterium sp.]
MVEPPDPRTLLIANERAKLTATYVNGVAIAVLAVGGLAPLFSQRAASAAPPDQPWLTPVLSLLCICVSGALHWAARGYLRELR